MRMVCCNTAEHNKADAEDTPSPTAPIPISEETGEPDNGIGISVDVGGDNNVEWRKCGNGWR
jgi:hypothetical protein